MAVVFMRNSGGESRAHIRGVPLRCSWESMASPFASSCETTSVKLKCAAACRAATPSCSDQVRLINYSFWAKSLFASESRNAATRMSSSLGGLRWIWTAMKQVAYLKKGLS